MPDTFEVTPLLAPQSSHKALKVLILIALGLLIVSFFSLWFGKPSFRDRDVVLILEGPTQALSGDEAAYKVKYENHTKLTLHDISFRFFYPSDSVVETENGITGDTTEGFEAENLKAGQKGEKELKAFLVGDKGNIKDAKVEMSFKAGSLTAQFSKSANVSTTIVGLPVSLTLVAPPSAVSGQEINYLLDYRNVTDADINDLMFEFKFPEGFNPRSFNPSPSSGKNVWIVDALRHGSGSRISIIGTLLGTERENKEIDMVLKRKVNGQYIDYEKASTSTVISSPLLGLTMTVNGSKDYASFVGDKLIYVIKFQNKSKQNLIGLSLKAVLEGSMYNFASLQPGGGFFDQNSSSILWNSSAIPGLASFGPGQSGQVEFVINLKPNFSGGSGSSNFFVKSTAILSTPNVPTGIDANEISTQSSITTKITSQPTLVQTGYYNDPAFGSAGPMPPQAGQETTYTVHWQITNPGNDLGETKVTGTLPAGINWKNIVSVGSGQSQPIFNKNRSEITWDLGSVPQGVGVSIPKYEATFQVSTTPSVIQKGNPITLIRDTAFFGVDNFTKQNIIVRTRDLTTNEMVDRPGDGLVQ